MLIYGWLTVFPLIIFIVVLLSALDIFWGVQSMTRLSCISPQKWTDHPLVSIIVPACNEAGYIEQAMGTLLEQDYGNFEIIAVDDRSTDNTGVILHELSQVNVRLRVLHIEELPDGWVGKNNALQRGADEAKGDYLLFTDADIMMEPTVLPRAVQRLVDSRLDHLTLVFRNSAPGWLLNSLILDAGVGLLQLLRPWRAKIKKSRYFIGVGAFNLVTRRAYESIGGHGKLRMHPIDDIMLGKLLKQKGYRQECLLGQDMINVPWYGSVAAMIEGLMKNVLAVINFNFWLVPLLLFAMFSVNILPFWGLLFSDGIIQILFVLTVATKMAVFYAGTRVMGISPWCVLGTLLTPYITFFIVVRAVWKNNNDGGIYWRGTFYPLDVLRKNESIFF